MPTDSSYNDDIEMTPDDGVYRQSSNIIIEDNSSQGTDPSITPISVIDSNIRTDDSWTKDQTSSGGTAGVTYNDTPPVENPPAPQLVYRTITRRIRTVIRDYSTSYLLNLYNQGATFYAVYTDGTEDEVSYTEIHDPKPIVTNIFPDEALEIAKATNQHFWTNNSGVFVTDVEQDEWLEAADDNFSDISASNPYNNILMNSLGILLRSALNTLVSISKSGVSFYDGNGNTLANMLASFGSNGALFRQDRRTRVAITADGLSIYDNNGFLYNNSTMESLGTRLTFIGVDANGKPYTRIGSSEKGYIDIGVNSFNNGYIDFYSSNTLLAHIGYDAGIDADGHLTNAPYYTFGIRKDGSTIGNYSLATGSNVEASGYNSSSSGTNTTASGGSSHAEGLGSTASGAVSHAEGYSTTAQGYGAHAEGQNTLAEYSSSHAEGYYTTAHGTYSHAEGDHTTANGSASHAEGYYTTAGGTASHAEGQATTASGNYSHAEGDHTTASGNYSHAEGIRTTASGKYSHAEGYYTTASGDYSHALGNNTKATKQYLVAIGKYNDPITNDLFEIGYGTTDSSRQNIFRVTEYGSVYAGSTLLNSDKRIKTDLGILDSKESLQFIGSLIPHKYEKYGKKELGFFAQDVEQDPNYGDILVEQYKSNGYDDFRSLNYDGLIAPIVSVEQNLIARVEHLEEENKQLKDQNEKLKDRLDNLESIIQQLISK